MQVTTPTTSREIVRLALRTTGLVATDVEAAICRVAALLLLTDGRCQEKHLSGKTCVGWQTSMQMRSVREFKLEVKDYNAAKNTFLAHDGWWARIGCKAAWVTTLKPHERIRFGLAEVELTERVDAMMNCEEWAERIPACKDNILLSAPAGYGEMHVIQHVSRGIPEKQYGKKGVWVTASTGLVALVLEGVTIHSASGLKRGNKKAQDLVNEMKSAVKSRWHSVKAIIIDEFSMLSANFLDLLDEVTRMIKLNKYAFGGVLIIFVGDFAQFAPVPVFQANTNPEGPRWKKVRANYAFESRVWAHDNFQCLKLKHCWRYDMDGKLGKFLPDITYHGVDEHGGVRRVNGPEDEDDDLHDDYADEAKIYYDENERTRSLFSGMPSPPVVCLKLGAKVLRTHKIDKDVRVGCMGLVQGVRDAAECMQESMLSVHDMGYGMDPAMAREDWGCVHLERLWPLVEFNANGSKTLKTVYPALMNIEDNLGRLICSRMQLPLASCAAICP